MRGEVSKREAI